MTTTDAIDASADNTLRQRVAEILGYNRNYTGRLLLRSEREAVGTGSDVLELVAIGKETLYWLEREALGKA